MAHQMICKITQKERHFFAFVGNEFFIQIRTDPTDDSQHVSELDRIEFSRLDDSSKKFVFQNGEKSDFHILPYSKIMKDLGMREYGENTIIADTANGKFIIPNHNNGFVTGVSGASYSSVGVMVVAYFTDGEQVSQAVYDPYLLAGSTEGTGRYIREYYQGFLFYNLTDGYIKNSVRKLKVFKAGSMIGGANYENMNIYPFSMGRFGKYKLLYGGTELEGGGVRIGVIGIRPVFHSIDYLSLEIYSGKDSNGNYWTTPSQVIHFNRYFEECEIPKKPFLIRWQDKFSGGIKNFIFELLEVSDTVKDLGSVPATVYNATRDSEKRFRSSWSKGKEVTKHYKVIVRDFTNIDKRYLSDLFMSKEIYMVNPKNGNARQLFIEENKYPYLYGQNELILNFKGISYE